MIHRQPLHKGISSFYVSGDITIEIRPDGSEIIWNKKEAGVDFNGVRTLPASQRMICNCDPNILLNMDDEARYARQVVMNLPENSAEYRRRISENMPPTVSIDSCIVSAIFHLWEMGIETTGCCCGHNVDPAWVGVIPKHYAQMFELGYEQFPVRMVNGSPHGLYTFYL